MGLREQASLLVAHGHPEARHYPVPVLWTEAKLVTKRLNRELANSALLTSSAINAAISKKGHQSFKKQIKKLTED